MRPDVIETAVASALARNVRRDLIVQQFITDREEMPVDHSKKLILVMKSRLLE